MRRLVLLLCLMPSLLHAATTYYVDKTNGSASNANFCTTTALPCLTINGGVGKMSAGDTLLIMGNGQTYVEALNNNIPAGTSWANFTRIAQYPAHTVTIQGTGSGSAVIYFEGVAKQYIEIDGLIIDGNNNPNLANNIKIASPGSPALAAHHIRIKNCEMKRAYFVNLLINPTGHDNEILNDVMHDNGKHLDSDSLYQYGMYIAGDTNLIEGNDVYDNGSSGMQTYSIFGASAPANNIIRRNKFHNNTVLSAAQGKGSGIVIWGNTNQVYDNLVYDNYGGIDTRFCTGTKIWNNTVHGNTTKAINIDNVSNVVVQNNIIYNNGSQFTITSASNPTYTANLCGSSGTGCNSTGNPSFVNAGAKDFHVNVGSPAIDAGIDLSAYFVVDYDNTARPLGLSFDRGAYEYATPASITVSTPNGGNNWQIGTTQTFAWGAVSVSGGVNIKLSRLGDFSDTEVLFTNTANDGTENWVAAGATTTTAKVRIEQNSNTSIFGISAAAFTLSSSNPGTITVLSPTNGMHFLQGQTVSISITTSGLSGNLRAKISYNNGSTFDRTIIASQAFDSWDGSWPVSGEACTQCVIKVDSLTDPSVFGLSGVFKLASVYGVFGR